MPVRIHRWRASAVAMLAALGLTVIGAATVGAKPSGRSDSGTAFVANTPKPGSLVYAAGFDQDKILGSGAILYAIKATTSAPGTIHVNAKSVTLFTANGSLKGTASATLTTTKSGVETVSNGKLSLTTGTGGQTGHSLKATFTGTGSVATLTFTFHYKGTYK